MTDAAGEPVSVSRQIAAPAAVVFAVLADPAKHPVIDGSGMLQRAVFRPPISRVGETFTMLMQNPHMGYYEMTNYVVEFIPGERIAWEPSLTNASRAEDQDDIGTRNHYRWSYELTPDGEDGTLVTETYDCTQAPERLRKGVKDGQRWVEAMTATLEKLEQECTRTPLGRSLFSAGLA
jgi:uncharacterized protein YndB with AHSA1/START domain